MNTNRIICGNLNLKLLSEIALPPLDPSPMHAGRITSMPSLKTGHTQGLLLASAKTHPAGPFTHAPKNGSQKQGAGGRVMKQKANCTSLSIPDRLNTL